MNHFHNAKIIATMWPSIDKETILAKIINNIDVFRINLSHGDEEAKKKYIDMILKLDSSKTIMLDTKGPEVRVRNKDEVTLKKNQKIKVCYAEFFKQQDGVLFIDYPNIHTITKGAVMSIDNDAVKVQITGQKDDYLLGTVTIGGTILINRWIEFENYIPKLPFLSEKDKKHIVRWVEHKINVIAISHIRNAENIAMVKQFLKDIWGQDVKIIAKIETKESIDNIEEIAEACDGISLSREKLNLLIDPKKSEKKKYEIIQLCNKYGIPLIMTAGLDTTGSQASLKRTIGNIVEEIKAGADAFLLTRETALADDAIDIVTMLYEVINDSKNKTSTDYMLHDLDFTTHPITDYIIYSAYRASKELPIKAIICPTESGYTPARLSSLKPEVPIIAFTKNDDAYRYLNLLRWVKGYKISSTFEYDNIKQIGKEIIRILFKGNISLDDKVLIVHSSLQQNVPHMINGIELYKFKDI